MNLKELSDFIVKFSLLDMVENFFVFSFILIKLKNSRLFTYKMLSMVSIMSIFTINLSIVNEAFGLVLERILVIALFAVVTILFYPEYSNSLKEIVFSVFQTFVVIMFFTVVVGFPFMNFIGLTIETMTATTHNLVLVSMPIRVFEFLMIYIMHRRLKDEETY